AELVAVDEEADVDGAATVVAHSHVERVGDGVACHQYARAPARDRGRHRLTVDGLGSLDGCPADALDAEATAREHRGGVGAVDDGRVRGWEDFQLDVPVQFDVDEVGVGDADGDRHPEDLRLA